MKFLFAALALVAAASAMPLPLRSNTGDSISYTQLGKFSVSNPAFFLVAPFQIDYPAPSDCLFITSFTGNPFSSGEIYVVENITSYANDLSNLNPISLNLSFAWPNSISAIPSNVLSQLQLPNGILVPDGFLVPGKNNGGLYVVTSQPGSAPVKYQINDPSVDKGFFYHSAVWVDMNGDGRLDLLSAHANKPLFGSTQTGLVWFEQPVGGLNSLPWQQNVITVGPDVFFTILEMDGSSDTLEIIATEFFSSQLTLNVVSITAAQPGALVYRRVIDSTIGAAYHSDVVMLAGKGGVQELLVNNHQAASSNGVYAYSIPSDLKNGQFVRRTLASGFPVTEGGFNQASPGFVYAVDPHMPSTGAAPYLMVAGDGAQSAYLLTPDSSSPPQYSSQTIIDVQGTVGSLFISDDWNGDGLREFLVPDYDHNVVYAYTFSS